MANERDRKKRNRQDYTAGISNPQNRQRFLFLSYYMSVSGQQGGLFYVTKITLMEKSELKDHSSESGTSSDKPQHKDDIYHFGLQLIGQNYSYGPTHPQGRPEVQSYPWPTRPKTRNT